MTKKEKEEETEEKRRKAGGFLWGMRQVGEPVPFYGARCICQMIIGISVTFAEGRALLSRVVFTDSLFYACRRSILLRGIEQRRSHFSVLCESKYDPWQAQRGWWAGR